MHPCAYPVSGNHYGAPLVNEKKYNKKISPICQCICLIISLFGLPFNAAECRIGYYNNRGEDYLKIKWTRSAKTYEECDSLYNNSYFLLFPINENKVVGS